MPMTTPTLAGRALQTSKDPLDLRDLMYEGGLHELPAWIDNRGKVPFVLDQGEEGACTGFGLAAVVNFLLQNRAGAAQLRRPEGASAYMLYDLARRYDEWDGADYEGSSIRGAMKGWHKHGVCSERAWPSGDGKKQGRLTTGRQKDAVARPLGNYFRVRHLHLSHVHSALAEVGILYASADVHSGWQSPRPDGRIPFRKAKIGGHAFAIVGYDDDGLWIQNSWGVEWGAAGFGHLSYDDWLENGYDCWVARMGVPTMSLAQQADTAENPALGRVMKFDYLPHSAAVSHTIRPHVVNLGDDGRLSTSGRYQTTEQDLAEIFGHAIPEITRSWQGPPRVLLYAHGGLNNEQASAARIASMRPYFLANEIYPIHFMWETGVSETIRSIVQDAFSNKRFAGIWDEVKERFEDLGDQAIELAVRWPGKALWSEMKENGTAASLPGRGADRLAKYLREYVLNDGPLELHLVGHSAGSILLANLVPALSEYSLPVQSLTLYAPACSVDLFRRTVLPELGPDGNVGAVTVFNLTDEAERADNVARVYHKSMLYLVSRAFEDAWQKPILGLETCLASSPEITEALGKRRRSGRTVIRTRGGANVGLRSRSTSHGGFDNDGDTLNSTLRIIRRTDRGLTEFPK